MQLFVFDYHGTLTTVDPLPFLTALRRKHPGACVVVMTGSHPSEIKAQHPGLERVLDAIWSKSDSFSQRLGEGSFHEITFVDDDPDFREIMGVRLRKHPFSVRILDESGLLGLLR